MPRRRSGVRSAGGSRSAQRGLLPSAFTDAADRCERHSGGGRAGSTSCNVQQHAAEAVLADRQKCQRDHPGLQQAGRACRGEQVCVKESSGMVGSEKRRRGKISKRACRRGVLPFEAHVEQMVGGRAGKQGWVECWSCGAVMHQAISACTLPGSHSTCRRGESSAAAEWESSLPRPCL